MAKIAPSAKFTAFDSTGAPLVGGKLYTYEAGTSTPKDTFTTAAGDVANTNPIILNSNGQADVWLGSGFYKFVLDNSSDVQQWSIDDISGDEQNAYAGNVVDITATYNVTANNNNNLLSCTGTLTLNLLAAASAGEGFFIIVENVGSGVVTIDPNGTETVGGASTFALEANRGCVVVCDGTNWRLTNYIADGSIGTTALEASSVTLAKMADLANMRVIGNTSGSTGTPEAVTILDEDDMSSDSATALATQQSIKAFAIAAADIATQAQMEAETTDKIATASNLIHHPGVAVCDGLFTASASPASTYLRDCTVTRNNSGVYDISFSGFTMADTNYRILFGAGSDGVSTSNSDNNLNYSNKSTSGFRIRAYGTGGSTTTQSDNGMAINFAVFGEVS